MGQILTDAVDLVVVAAVWGACRTRVSSSVKLSLLRAAQSGSPPSLSREVPLAEAWSRNFI